MAFCWICGIKYDIAEGQSISLKPEHNKYKICTVCQFQKNQLHITEDPQEYIAYFEKFIPQIRDPIVLEGIKDILTIPEPGEKLNALEPCPCCGCQAEYISNDTEYKVHCPDCDLSTRWCVSLNEAQTLWDRRVDK
jgi:hypothetical protein